MDTSANHRFTAKAGRNRRSGRRHKRRRQRMSATDLSSRNESSANIVEILSPPSSPSYAFLPSFIAPTAAVRFLADNTLTILTRADAPNASPSGSSSTSNDTSSGSTGNSTSTTTTTTTTPTSTSTNNSGSGSTAGIVGAIVAIIVVVAIVTICIIRRRRRKSQQAASPPPAPPSQPPAPHVSIPTTPPQKSLLHPAVPTDPVVINPSSYGPSSYTYQQLADATAGFQVSQLLGKGGFGSVYKGEIAGVAVAVKSVDDGSRQGLKEFKAEVNIISDLRHRNLVKLRGWCYEGSRFFLVYEYVANGSLDGILFNDDRCCRELTWQRRFNIVLGLGSALQYLHEECEAVIIHRDVKTSNVLLDEKYAAKLGDFGLSRQMGETQYTTVVAGTRGYIAPEVFITGKSNKESDVFSFGAVLAEVACGKRVVDGRGAALVDWVWDHLPAAALLQAADERLCGDFVKEEMERVLLVALACSHPDPLARPSIRLVMDILRGTLPLPEVPIYKPTPTYASTPGGSAATSSTYGATSTSSSYPG